MSGSSNPNAIAYILYKDIRTPGQTELFYKQVQSDPGVMLTKAEIAEVGLGDGGKLRINATDTLLGANVDLRGRSGGSGHRHGPGDCGRIGA